MRGVVLVGGFGTRLRPLTLTRPKQMLPVVHRPMLEYVVAALSDHGVDEVVLSLGYQPDVFRAAFPAGLCADVPLRYVVEPEPLDTAGAIAFAAREAGVCETFVAVNGDVLTDIDVSRLVALHRDRGAEATIALTPVDDPSRYGVVPVDDDNRVEAFIEKPAPGTAPCNWINAGTYVLEPALVDRVPAGRRVSIERETFPALVQDRSLYGLGFEDYWIDAGTPRAYLDANLDLVSGRRSRRWTDPPVSVDAAVEPGAVVSGSVIGADCEIGHDARVTSSVLGIGVVVESGALVDSAILGDRAVVRAGARVVDCSVVGDGAEVPPGVVLAGARLPEPD